MSLRSSGLQRYAPSSSAFIFSTVVRNGVSTTRPGTEAIVDDLAARRCAHALGVPVRGTLGLVLLGKERRRLPAARPVLEFMRQAGMYLSDRVMERALRMVGE